MTLDGDTLTGTWAESGGEWSFPIEFHRVGSDPMSPYTGRPQVLDADCNGWSINITWDRPVNGWDYDIRNENNQSIADWDANYNCTYEPNAHTYHIPLHTTAPLVPGETYTVYLEWPDDDETVDWHDPYGIPAWDWSGDCYSFEFTYQQLPPAPGMILGYHTPGMPAQWVTITAQWPSGCSGLKLYQSADKAVWHDTGLIPTPRFGSGDFTFELPSSAYFRVTALAGGLESPPSQKVHARPFEVETSGIVIDTPPEGATGVSQTPTISWHPAWTQSVTLQRYGLKVIDPATGDVMWSPTTAQNPPQTSLLYGQTGGVLSGPATPLARGTAYSILLGAFDNENWMFATAPERHFTTTADGNTGGTPEDYAAIHALFEAMKTALEAHDLNAAMALFSEGYLQDGVDKATQQSYIEEGVAHVVSVEYEITSITVDGDAALVGAPMTVTFDNQDPISFTEPSSGSDGLGMGWLTKQGGEWLIYGDQQRGRVDVYTCRMPDGSYALWANAAGVGLTAATIQGPYISPTDLTYDPEWNEFYAWIAPWQTPNVGDVYTFDLDYGGVDHEIQTDSIASLVPVSPTLFANAQPDSTILLTWDDVSGLVPYASRYSVEVDGPNGFHWQSGDLSLDTLGAVVTGIVDDGFYDCRVYIYDDFDDAAQGETNVIIGEGPPPPPF